MRSSIAIMQPYVFPYLGYYQLIAAVKKFVIYDDVTFIKQGWINRNNVLISGNPFLFTIPLEKVSSFTYIKDTRLNEKLYPIWMEKFLKTIEQNYKKAPYFDSAYQMIREVFSSDAETISQLAFRSLAMVTDYLNIEIEYVQSSVIYNNSELKGQDRIINICKKEKAERYINLAGGQELYSKDDFKVNGLILDFIKSKQVVYPQFGNKPFVPWLSMIDVMMFNDSKEISGLLNNYEII